MATCARCRGVLNVVIQGRSFALQSDGDVTVYASNFTREEVTDGNADFTMSDYNPRIIVTVQVPDDMYVRDLQELCGVPIVVELCNGRTFSAEEASNINTDPFDAKTGYLSLELIAPEIVELLPQAVAA